MVNAQVSATSPTVENTQT